MGVEWKYCIFREKIVSLWIICIVMKSVVSILFLLLTFVACERYESDDVEINYSDEWEVDFSLASANSVVYNDTLYLLFGRSEGGSAENPSKNIYYAPMSDLSCFKQIDLPIDPRVNAATILIGDKLYFGLGFRGLVYGSNSLLRDWWQYDFATHRLTRLADFPTNDVLAPVIWNDGNFIYTLFGYNVGSSGVVYRYDILMDEWSIYSNKSAPIPRADALSGVVDGVLYCGGGSSSYMKQDWWKYDWKKNTWSECAQLPRAARVFASSVTIGNCIFVLGGRFFGGTETREHFFSTIILYDVLRDKWVDFGRMEKAGENMVAFEYDGDLYWGLGQSKDGEFIKKLYKKEL